MKRLPIILLTLFLISSWSCKREVQSNRELQEEAETSLSIKYKQKINGYTVRVAFILCDTIIDRITGFGTLYFTNDKSQGFDIYSSFSIADSIKLQQGIVNELDYIVPNIDYKSPVCLSQFNKIPFFFLDVDFDGENELLLRIPNNGQKSVSTYNVMRIDNSQGELSVTPENMYDNLLGNDGSSLDDFTTFNYSNQEVMIYNYGGYSDSEGYFYKIKGGKPQLCRKEVYDSLGYVLSKRETYIGKDTIIEDFAKHK